MTNHTQLSVENHFRFSTEITKSAQRALEQAEETGDTRAWLDALKTAVMVQEFGGRELIRYKVRKQVIEAAAVLNGEFDGQEEVSLGTWADGYSADDITDRASEIIENHRALYS